MDSSDAKKIIWVSTVPLSMKLFCSGLLKELAREYVVSAVSSPGTDLNEISKNEGITVHPIEIKRGISPLSDLKSLWQLVGHFRREKPHMVHSITPKAGFLAMTAAKIARVPVRIHTFTGLIFPTARGFKRLCCRLTDRLTCTYATHIIAESQGVRNDLATHNITGKEINILGHGNLRGIDLDHFRPDEHLYDSARQIRALIGATEHTVVFMFAGRVARDKGITELVEAFRRLKTDGYDVRLLIVGEHDESDPVDEVTMKEIRNDPGIYFTERWISDIRPYYCAADILVLPSYREGMPNVVIEACAMGKPAIVSDVNGSREIVLHGNNGLIVPPRDTGALHEAMKKLTADSSMRNTMAGNARQSVASRFEQRMVRNHLLDFYRKAMP